MSYSPSDTLIETIDKFINEKVYKKRELDKIETVLRNGLVSELHKNKDITIQTLNSNKCKDIIGRALVDTMIKIKMKKLTAYNVFKKFFFFLNSNYDVRLNIEDFLKKPLEDKKERQIDILKQLHAKPMTKDELKDIYYISSKTLKTDLNKLENGTEFLGQDIKINLEINNRDRTIGYKSTVHPVFLALNMMEAYALTAGLKKAGIGTAYEDIFNDLADSIYFQLSNYGQKLINQSMRHKGDSREIRFNKRQPRFRDEREMFKKSMQNRLFYHEKRSFAYEKGMEIIADIDGNAVVFENARFRINWPDKVTITYGEGNLDKTIKMDQIISITAKESEYGEKTDYKRKG